MTCLHPNCENNTTRPHLNQHFAFALQEPAIVKRRRSRPGGSTNRINNPTQWELSAFERSTGCTTRARAGRNRGRARLRRTAERSPACRLYAGTRAETGMAVPAKMSATSV